MGLGLGLGLRLGLGLGYRVRARPSVLLRSGAVGSVPLHSLGVMRSPPLDSTTYLGRVGARMGPGLGLDLVRVRLGLRLRPRLKLRV